MVYTYPLIQIKISFASQKPHLQESPICQYYITIFKLSKGWGEEEREEKEGKKEEKKKEGKKEGEGGKVFGACCLFYFLLGLSVLLCNIIEHY